MTAQESASASLVVQVAMLDGEHGVHVCPWIPKRRRAKDREATHHGERRIASSEEWTIEDEASTTDDAH